MITNSNHDFDYVSVCDQCPLWDFERGCIHSLFASQIGNSFDYTQCTRFYYMLRSNLRIQEELKRQAEQEYLNYLKVGELPF